MSTRRAWVVTAALAVACAHERPVPHAVAKAQPRVPAIAAPGERVLEAKETTAEIVRIGAVGFGGNPSFLAVSADERWVATSLGMAGAEVEVFDGRFTRVAKVSVDLERAVRALDFFADGSLLVSLTGGRSHGAALETRSIDGKVLRTIELPPDGKPEGRALADASVVVWSAGKLVRFSAGGATPETVATLPNGAALSTSPNKRLLTVSTADEVTLYDVSKLDRPVARQKREGRGAAFATDDGALLFQDRTNVVLLPKAGARIDLGPGEPLGLGPRYAIVRTPSQDVAVVDRRAKIVGRTSASRAWLSPKESLLFAHSGADADYAVTALPLDGVVDGSIAIMRSPPRSLAISNDGTSVIAPDGDAVVEWDVGSRKFRRRTPLPTPSSRGVVGMFRSASALFVMAGEVYRYTGRGLEPAGGTTYSGPRAFVRHDGSTLVCVSDALQHCQAHFVLGPGETRVGEVTFPFIFPLGGGRGFAEGPYTSDGSDLGVASKSGGPVETLERTWVRDVYLWRAVPAGDVGIILTAEGPDPSHRPLYLRRVFADHVSDRCALGELDPSTDAPMTAAPDGRIAAVVVRRAETDALVFADVDSCKGSIVKLPQRAVGADFSADGRTIAVGLADRSFVLVAPHSNRTSSGT